MKSFKSLKNRIIHTSLFNSIGITIMFREGYFHMRIYSSSHHLIMPFLPVLVYTQELIGA